MTSVGKESEEGVVALPSRRAMPILRPSVASDMMAVTAIYAGHVRTGTCTFEEVPPDETEMAARRRTIVGQGLPYLVVEHDGEVVGFAYAAPFRSRSAYRYTVEDSIYIHPQAMGLGLGRVLLGQVIDICTGLGFRQMIAVIGDSANKRSIRLHAGLGFHHAGLLSAAGFKFNRWIDSVYMQRALGLGDGPVPPPDLPSTL